MVSPIHPQLFWDEEGAIQEMPARFQRTRDLLHTGIDCFVDSHQLQLLLEREKPWFIKEG